jgi:glutaredoxin
MLRIRGVEEVTVEIITLNPIMIGHCEHCEILMKGFGIDYKVRQLEEYPKEVLELSAKITEFIRAISRRFYARVIIIEALTPLGLYKMIRYRSGKLPVIVVNGRKISSGDIDDPVALAEKAYRVALETSH